MKKSITISFIILTFNEEKNIKKILTRLEKIKIKNSEILVIDSESTDKTPLIIKQMRNKIKNLFLFQIKREEFDFGETRNFAVKKAKGKYICFISADAYPLFTNKIIKYLKEDFSIDKKVVCVYGKQIPYPNHNFLYRAEINCLFNYLNNLIKINQSKVLLQKDSFYSKKDKMLYFISNVFAIYKKNFLLKFPFRKGKCEDIKMGKCIIDNSFAKIYDPRLSVMHSHNFTIKEYLERQKEEFKLIKRLKINKFSSTRIMCKLKQIYRGNFSLKTKFFLIIKFFYIYLIKLLLSFGIFY